ncbi:MAG: hypothetical protein ACJ72B_18755 [Ornithinibacter sp.]
MPRRTIGLLLAVLTLLATTGCGPTPLRTLAEDIAAATGASADDILRRAEQQAGTTGSSTDDIVQRWRGTVVVGAGRELEAYRDVPEDVRSFTCDVVTSVLADDLDGDASTDPSPLGAALDAVAGLNPSAGAHALAQDLQEAKADLDAGRPATLTLLVLKTGVCAVIAS